MRNTVDEKLQSNLEKRFNDSFTLISDRLELVHKGLGEMQTLANSVGDIKKVMTNVKSRGVLGEYQLANILEDLLTNDQYQKNVKIDQCKKSFKASIIKNAKDIKEKYIDPPNTTEYGLMFLPFESLYAEVLRIPGLFETIQRDYKITITGPTTLSALLSSLQMGFRTLAIEKRSSEVWDLLGGVKTEFGKFGTVLEKTKKKLQEATNTIEQASVRSKAIERKLKNVQDLPSPEVQNQIENEVHDSKVDLFNGLDGSYDDDIND
ncbi:MAG: DNA recombination protein RmuC [Saprospiraceae bacterium]|nr:DNA recombination protein RmuC [Saprospiraceae bacterium]